MKIIRDIEKILEMKNIGEISFIRTSFYDSRFASEEKEAAITAIIQMVLALRKEKPTNYTILKNETSLLVTFDFNHKCLVNLAFSTWENVTTPVFKIEIVGANGMLQFDTQADNAYAGTYYQSSLSLATPEISPELITYSCEFIEKINVAQEMEVIVG